LSQAFPEQNSRNEAPYQQRLIEVDNVGLRAPPIVNVEFESRIRRENLGDLAQPFGHRSGGQRRVVALAQIVCAEDFCTEDRISDGATVERGWVALKLEGPILFSMSGVLASFVEPLAAAQIPIFAISTFDTDYVLIKRQDLERAVRALAAAGHEKAGEETG
jgi:hypothetical protein